MRPKKHTGHFSSGVFLEGHPIRGKQNRKYSIIHRRTLIARSAYLLIPLGPFRTTNLHARSESGGKFADYRNMSLNSSAAILQLKIPWRVQKHAKNENDLNIYWRYEQQRSTKLLQSTSISQICLRIYVLFCYLQLTKKICEQTILKKP